MATNTLTGNFSADVSLYIAKKLLMLAQKQLILYQLCDKAQMPKNSGRTMQYTRYERVDLPQSTLTEGVTPGDSSMAITTVSVVMDQWGAVIPISDVAIDSVKHPVLQQAITLAGRQAKETIDREIAKTLLTGTSVFFPAAITSRPNLTAGNKLESAAIGKLVASLRALGAAPREDGHFVGVMHPYSEEDIINDTKFIEAHRYGQVKKLMNQEVGTWKGVRWVRSNALPFISLLTGATGVGQDLGSLLNSTPYDFKITIIDKATGYETHCQAKLDVTTGAADESVDITLPALPSNATAGSTFKIYAGANGGVMYLSKTGQAAAAVVNITAIPTSGEVAPADPPAALTVYHSWVFGVQSVICAELNKVKAYLTPATPSDSDPLVQRRKVGWKCDFKTVIANDDFLARLEHVTTTGNL